MEKYELLQYYRDFNWVFNEGSIMFLEDWKCYFKLEEITSNPYWFRKVEDNKEEKRCEAAYRVDRILGKDYNICRFCNNEYGIEEIPPVCKNQKREAIPYGYGEGEIDPTVQNSFPPKCENKNLGGIRWRDSRGGSHPKVEKPKMEEFLEFKYSVDFLGSRDQELAVKINEIIDYINNN